MTKKLDKLTSEPYFAWSDAWVFAALASFANETRHVDFGLLIAAGDLLNHAIFTREEIQQALSKLHARGLVDVRDATVIVTPSATGLHEKIKTMRGGMFTVVDNTLKVLNSPRTKMPPIGPTPDVSFLTNELLKRAYEAYKRRIR